MISVLIKLLMGHAIADFALQSHQMAKGKNRNVPPDYVPPGQTPQTIWPYYLGAHGLIHGAMVTIITGNVWWGMAEALCHSAIDLGKCDNYYGVHEDQTMHIAFKVLIAIMVTHAL